MARNRVSASFMTRLARDKRGNTVAIMAAAFVPLAGLIGGGVDMSRLYLTKTRLQQACDAGALAGRKAMGSGSWTEGSSTSSRTRANELFKANFKQGAYGTTLTNQSYSEDDGEVRGVAAVTVPMTLMRIFGMQERSMTVTCTAKMEIPNTDVMFVLDVTGSMNCPTGNTTCSNNGNVPATNARITGLKKATKCFYEALMRVNTPEDCTVDGSVDPTAATYTGTAQIRLGFVPYSVNVNLGKLLHNDWLANSWNYQSRAPKIETVYSWTAGAEGTKSAWTNSSTAPTNLNTASNYSSWTNVSGTGSLTINGVSRTKQPSVSSATNCTNLNTMNSSSSTNKMLDYVEGASILQAATGPTSSPPTHPASQQVLTYTRGEDHPVTGYKYTWVTTGNGRNQVSTCQLQSGTRTYTINQTATSTKPVTWATHERIAGWDYKQVTFDVSGLKAGGSSWNNSVALPLSYGNGATVKLSGSNSNTTLSILANRNVTWDGCIEERKTVKNTDGDASNEWSPIPTDANDLNIDMIPSSSTAGSQWAPMLEDAVWGRYTGNNNDNRTLNTVSANEINPDHPRQSAVSYYCSTEAKKLQPWYTPGGFVSYVNSLSAIGNTYHDIGLIWGARFISPTGIFAAENAETPTGGAIQRHMIFMTDGKTETAFTNYTAFGLPWWDRRQTTGTPTNDQLTSIVNAKMTALCSVIKNRNITLWVVSYGGAVDEVTEGRLRTCATSGKFFSAADTPTLIRNFKQIASEIADLRLVN